MAWLPDETLSGAPGCRSIGPARSRSAGHARRSVVPTVRAPGGLPPPWSSRSGSPWSRLGRCGSRN